MLFEELNRSKRIEEPEERKAEELKRAPQKRKKGFGRKKSVSLNTVHTTLTIVGFLGAIAIVAGVVYLGYLGYGLYVNG